MALFLVWQGGVSNHNQHNLIFIQMASCVPQILQTALKTSHVSTRSSVTKEVLCCALGAKDGTLICGTAQHCSESEREL